MKIKANATEITAARATSLCRLESTSLSHSGGTYEAIIESLKFSSAFTVRPLSHGMVARNQGALAKKVAFVGALASSPSGRLGPAAGQTRYKRLSIKHLRQQSRFAAAATGALAPHFLR